MKKDDSGQWSHWSAPATVKPRLYPSCAGVTGSSPGEIRRHGQNRNADQRRTNSLRPLKNMGAAPIDINNWTLADGVEYPTSSRDHPGARAFVVLAEDTSRFQSRYGMAPFRPVRRAAERRRRTITGARYFLAVPSCRSCRRQRLAELRRRQTEQSARTGLTRRRQATNASRLLDASTAISSSPGVDDRLPVLVNEVRFKLQLPLSICSARLCGITAADIGSWNGTSDRRSMRPAAGTQPPWRQLIL